MNAIPDNNLVGGRPTWAEVDLEALASNYRWVRGRVGANVRVMSVVKADAYGHGAVRCARRLAAEGSDWFAVATPEEGVELRTAGILAPILCLGGFWEGQAAICLRENLVPVVYRLDMIEALDRVARERGTNASVHLKVDTGMGRLGVRHDEIAEFVAALGQFKNIRLDGVMTHFAAADLHDLDEFTGEQIARFREAVSILRAAGHQPTYEDLANSAGIYAHPASWGSMVRPGGVLYGLWRDILPESSDAHALRSVFSLRTKVTLVKRVLEGEALGYGCTFRASKEMMTAILPIGYHDGYPRALSNRARVIVRGSYAPVVGRVSMDLTIIDVTASHGVTPGDTVTLLGTQDGLSITAEELARDANTLSYEITCGISGRVPRYYRDEGR